MTALKIFNADIVYAGMCRRFPDGSVMDHLARPFSREDQRRMTLADSSTLVARRFSDIHFSRVPRGKHDFPMEDWELLWRYSRRRAAQLVPAVTVDYLVHEGSYLTPWRELATDLDRG